MVPPDLGRVVADGLLHGKGRVAGAHGVVLVGQGGAEKRHDAVAHDLVDGALVAVHRFHQALEDRVQELPGVLRVAVGEQLERAFHVGEEHRHLLALPLERVAGPEDPLGQVARRVALEGREGRFGDGRRRDGPPALVAEAAARQVGVPHAGQATSSRPPQPLQNLAPGGLSCRH